MQNQRTVKYESDYRNKSGKRIVLETVKSPINSNGSVTGIVGISRDVTEKRTNEEDLRKNRRILDIAETITQSTSFEYDATKDKITCSRNFQSLMGTSSATNTFPLKNLLELIYKNDRSLFNDTITHALETKSEFSMEFRYITPTNQTRYAKIKLNPDKESKGNLFYGMIVDITNDRLNTINRYHVQENERKAISRELHDNIGQKLSAAKIYLDQLQGLKELPDTINIAYKLIHESLKDTRQISLERCLPN